MPITKDDIKSDISLKKTEVTIDLSKELKGLPKSVKEKISEQVAKMVRAEVGNDAVNKSKSSVTGDRFKKLSKTYKKIKRKEGQPGKANLVLNGDMLGNLKQQSAVQTVKLKITKPKEIKKFFNHNTGDTLPKRQALPNEGESFRPGIMRKINKIINEAKKAENDS